MSKSIEKVNSSLRLQDMGDLPSSVELDIATVQIKHEYFPAENIMTVEFAIPTIKKQMLTDSYEEIERLHLKNRWHGLEYLDVDNSAFHRLLRENKTDKLRVFNEETREWYTYYFSKTEVIRARFYDYEAALLAYIKYPTRNFVRRTPCKRLDPECSSCDATLDAPVDNFLGYLEEDNRADYYDFWFRQIGERHELLIAYTIEKEFEYRYSEEPVDPKYYNIDFSLDYFTKGYKSKQNWEANIYSRRMNSSDEFYALSFDIGLVVAHLIKGCTLSSYNSSMLPKALNDRRDSPVSQEPNAPYVERGSDFKMLAWFDMSNLGARNSWHKWRYNDWIVLLNGSYDGWFCAWSGSDSLGEHSDSPVIVDMTNNLLSTIGWEVDTEGGNTDTEYTVSNNKIDGYEYLTVREPR